MTGSFLDISPRHAMRWFWGWLVYFRSKMMPGTVAPRMKRRILKEQEELISNQIRRLVGGESLHQVITGFDGSKFSERVVEYPYAVKWLLQNERGVAHLDVGCTLNHCYLDSLLSEACSSVWFCNPALEPIQLSSSPVYYHVAELAEAFPGGMSFASITCLSTIEHVGFDNSQYGVQVIARYSSPTIDPFIESLSSLCNLQDRGGQLLVSFPFGFREVLIHPFTGRPSSQVIDYSDLRRCQVHLEKIAHEVKVEVFEARRDGWFRVDRPENCKARYGTRTPGAAAVAFLKIRAGQAPRHTPVRIN